MTPYKNVTTVLQNTIKHVHTALPQNHQSFTFVQNYMSSFQNIQQRDNEPLVSSASSLKNYKKPFPLLFATIFYFILSGKRSSASLPASFSYSLSQVFPAFSSFDPIMEVVFTYLLPHFPVEHVSSGFCLTTQEWYRLLQSIKGETYRQKRKGV